ncbi:hypothetical protein CFBP4215_00815 [Pseudomonas syringae pv. syringae]|nr:hypothetical protein CFBP4215_00815 [Pseudomonas syringae pv. syringae]
MPFWTLRVLLTTQSVVNCIPTLEREERSSHYRAALCVACISGRSASSCDAERRELHSHAGACGTIISLSCGAPRRMPFWTLRVLLTTQSVVNCSPLEREERSSQLSCGALRRMPFRTLRVLLATQSVVNCIPTLERAERSSHYRAALCGACRSGRYASSWRRRASGTVLPRWSVRNDHLTIVRRSASHAVLDAPRPLDDAERRELHSHAGA